MNDAGATHRKTLGQDFVRRVLTLGAMLGIQIAQSIVVARVLGPEGKGALAVLLWAPEILAVAFGGVGQSATWALGKELDSRERLVQNTLGLACAASLLGMLVATGAFFVLGLGGLGWASLVAAALMVPGVVGVRYVQALGMGMRWMSRVNRLHLVQRLVTLVAVVVLLVPLSVGVAGVPFGLATGGALAVLLALPWVREIGALGLRLDRELQRTLLGRGVFFSAALVVYTLNYRVDYLLLDGLTDKTTVGLYSQGVQVIELVLRIPAALVTVIFAHSATAGDAEAFRQRTRRILTRAAPLMILAAAGVAAVSPWLVPLAFGEDFRGSVPMIWALAPGIVAIGIFQVAVSDLNGRGLPQIGFRAGLVGLAANLALNVVLIPRLGGVGAALASTVSYTLVAAVVMRAHGRAA